MRNNGCFEINCPENHTFVGDVCKRTSCSKGFVLKDGQCFQTECESGFIKQGDQCTRFTCSADKKAVGATCVDRCGPNTQWNGQSCQITSCQAGFKLENGACVSTCTMQERFDVEKKICVRVPCGTGYKEVNGTCQEIQCESNQVRRGNDCILARCTVEGQIIVNGECVQSICAPGEQTIVKNGAQVCISTNCSSTERFIRNIGCRARCEEHFNHNTEGVCVRISCPVNQVLTVDGQCAEQCKTGEIKQGNRCVQVTCKITENLVGTACVQKTCESGSKLTENGVCEKVVCDEFHTLTGSECVRTRCPAGFNMIKLNGLSACIKACDESTVPSTDGQTCVKRECEAGSTLTATGC